MMKSEMISWADNYYLLLLLKNEHSVAIITISSYSLDLNKFLFFENKKNPKNKKPFIAVFFVWQFIGSSTSFFERHARWNLNLGSKFTNRKKKKKRKKKIKPQKLNTHGQIIIVIIIVYMCKILSATFVSISQSRSRNSKKW